MSAGEFFLTLLVALVAFGPNQLPMLAKHLGQWVAKGRRYKQLAVATWQSQLNALQLQERVTTRICKQLDCKNEKDELETCRTRI